MVLSLEGKHAQHRVIVYVIVLDMFLFRDILNNRAACSGYMVT